jgi:hypothetical protein
MKDTWLSQMMRKFWSASHNKLGYVEGMAKAPGFQSWKFKFAKRGLE